MEETNSFDEVVKQQEHPQLIITENMRSYIYDMAGWAKFLAILGFIFSGMMMLMAFFAGAVMGTLGAMGNAGLYGTLGSGVFTFVFVLYGVLFLYPSLMLFKYATKAKQGVLYADQASLEDGMSKLKSFFKFYGILAIVVIAFYSLIFLGAVAGGLAGN